MVEDFKNHHDRILKEKGFTRLSVEDSLRLRLSDKTASVKDLAEWQSEVYEIISELDSDTSDADIVDRVKPYPSASAAISTLGALSLLGLLVSSVLLPVGVKPGTQFGTKNKDSEGEQTKRDELRERLVEIHADITERLRKADPLNEHHSDQWKILPEERKH